MIRREFSESCRILFGRLSISIASVDVFGPIPERKLLNMEERSNPGGHEWLFKLFEFVTYLAG